MMHDERVFASFFESMLEKEALNPIQKGLQWAGGHASKVLRPVDKSVRALQNTGVGSRMASGAALGGGAGAMSDSDNRVRGALVGAGIGSAVGGAGPWALRQGVETARHGGQILMNPVKSMKGNWAAMSHKGQRGEELLKGKSLTQGAAELAEGSKLVPKKLQEGLTRQGKKRTETLQKGREHLANESEGGLRGALRRGEGAKGKAKEVAEELSRSGYTGAGGVTKYLPVGQKALTLGFMGLSAPTVYQSATGQIPLSEGVGEVGSQLGYLAGAGAGFIPSIAISELARMGTSAPVRAAEQRLGQGQPAPQYQWQQR